MTVTDPFDGPCYAAELSETTIRNARRAYGAWLYVQNDAGDFDPNALPVENFTPANVRYFHAALRARGNTDNTIVTRFYDLHAALRIMQPEHKLSWLISPGGISIRRQLQPEPKRKHAVRSALLLEWGCKLMETAPGRHRVDFRLTQFRDGLLIAMLAHLAPRIRSIAGLRIGRHFIETGEGFRIVLGPDDNKTGREGINLLVPQELKELVAHYLTVIRPQLLGNARHDLLWVNANGTPLLPDFPGLAAKILAVSLPVLEGCYNRAQQQQAIQVFLDHIQSERLAPD
ncbi:MAG: hypothetical protein KIC89_22520 [Acetobacteraceae bacterium]|nr:hypothetical protein [Acetobacteraceae bacterium]